MASLKDIDLSRGSHLVFWLKISVIFLYESKHDRQTFISLLCDAFFQHRGRYCRDVIGDLASMTITMTSMEHRKTFAPLYRDSLYETTMAF
jgi:hypothetical protein